MAQYITLREAKGQLAIDEGLTIHDERITLLIGAAIDWAQSFTQRSLGELMVLTDPPDASATPLPEPVYSPAIYANPDDPDSGPGAPPAGWGQTEWNGYLVTNPLLRDHSMSLRRDVKAGILLRIELLFDRNVDNFKLLDDTSHDLLRPYRIGLGV